MSLVPSAAPGQVVASAAVEDVVVDEVVVEVVEKDAAATILLAKFKVAVPNPVVLAEAV